MAGDNNSDYAVAFRKEMEKMPETLPSMTEMLRNEAESSAYTERYKKTFGVDEYHVPDAATILTGAYSREEITGLNSRTRHLEDLSLRAALKGQDGLLTVKDAGAERKKLERELAFRTKEESYKKKNSEQEKAAKQRNERFSGVDTGLLEDEADEIEADLAKDIDENDSYLVGYREYQKQYLVVIRDLIATRAQEGKWFGNYSSHIALAEEKYRFYSEESERIIGREQAKALMSRQRFEDLEDVEKLNHSKLEFDLTQTDQFDDTQPIFEKLSATELNTVKKAMKEYRESGERAYELSMQIAALYKLFYEDEEKKQAEVVAEEESPEAKARKARGRDPLTDEFIAAHVATVNPALHKYIESLKAEVQALCFNAEAGALCIKHILDQSSDDHMYGMNVFGNEEDTLSAHAGYIQSHYGVSISGVDTKARLRDQEIAKRVGLDTVDSDVSRFVRDPQTDSGISAYFRRKWANRSRDAATGYGQQDGYERTALEAANFGVIEKFAEEELPVNLRGKTGGSALDELTAKKAAEVTEKCMDMAVLLQPLPDVRMVRSDEIGTDIQSLRFSGSRNAQGEFEDKDHEPETGAVLDAKVSEFKIHMKNRNIIEHEMKNPDLVKEAIISELPLVFEAFKDIDAFMNVGESKKIFTAKSHEDVFRYTAGMPTFERKVRQLRDLLSLMLHRGKLVDEIGQETGEEGLRKSLFEKWLFTNRALSFVDYRRQIMEMGYDSTMEDWSDDDSTLGVESFWEGGDHTKFEWTGDKWGFIPLRKQKEDDTAEDDSEEEHEVREVAEHAGTTAEAAAAATAAAATATARAAAAAAAAEPDDEESGSDEAEAVVTYADMIARWQAELDEAHVEVLERRQQFDEAVSGMTENEKHFLRMEYYETRRFKTRQQQEDAIRADLRKGTQLSTYEAAHVALLAKIEEIKAEQRKLRKPSKELNEQLASLREQTESLLELKRQTEAKVDERAEQLVRLVKRPDTIEEGIEETMEALRKTTEDPNADGTIDAALKAVVASSIRTMEECPEDEKEETALALMKQLKDSIKDSYGSALLAYVRRGLGDLERNSRYEQIKPEERARLAELMEKIGKMLNETRPEDYEDIVDTLTGAYRIIGRPPRMRFILDDNFNKIDNPVPGVVLVYRYATYLENVIALTQADQKNHVSFAQDVGVQYKEKESDEKTGETKEWFSEGTADLDEEEKYHEQEDEYKAVLKKHYNPEAYDRAVEMKGRAKAAAGALQGEVDSYISRIRRLSTPSYDAIPGSEHQPATKKAQEEKNFLCDLGALMVPLSSTDKTDLTQDEQRELNLNMQAVRAVTSEFARPETVKDSLVLVNALITSAYEDIGSFITKEPGSRILQGRVTCNFFRSAEEPAEPDNYSEDTEGMGMLMAKVFELQKVMFDAVDKGTLLEEDERRELERKAAVIDELSEFLSWRKKMLDELDGIDKKSEPGKALESYIMRVRSVPEEYTHEPFVWRG